MKAYIIVFWALLLFSLTATAQKNLVVNGDFEDGLNAWNGDGATATPWVFKNGKLACAIITYNDNNWVAVDQQVNTPKKLGAVNISAWVKTENVVPGKDSWNGAIVNIEFFGRSGNKTGDLVNLTSLTGTQNWALYTKTVQLPANTTTVKITLAMGFASGSMFIDDVSVSAAATNNIAPALGILINNQGIKGIRMNQLGFYPGSAKIAVVTGNVPATGFYIISAVKKDTVLKGKLSAARQSAYSSTVTKIADLSTLKLPGDYIIKVPGEAMADTFKIANDINEKVAVAVLKGFYYQRSNIPLLPRYAGKWNRAAGHPDTTVYIHPSAASKKRPAGTIIATPGGWYDAGDYNKYIVNSGISTATLLSAYEDFPARFDTLKTNIPESSNAVPDILDEALYNMRWMLTMQDPDDGGVYTKCTNTDFDGIVMPGVNRMTRYVVEKSTGATLDFAAVMAQGARIFKKFDKALPGLADSCLHASEKAWQWAKKNPDVEYNQAEMNKLYEPKILTGEYGDHDFSDEFFWAAAELFCTTGDKDYYQVINAHFDDDKMLVLPSWFQVGMLGYYTLLRKQKYLPAYTSEVLKTLRSKVISFADNEIANVTNSAFNTILGQSKYDFSWGSNGIAANQDIVLINAYLLTKDKKYIDYALTNLDYLLGRNATGYCFVTGMSSRSSRHPHHLQSEADGINDPVPGLLTGGPNGGMQDNCHYDYTEPETAYMDIDCSSASNEIAINWNAPMVYLTNAIESLKMDVNYVKQQSK
jgi:endoglucanase